MVLHMVLHVPIVESSQPRARKSACIESIVGNVRVETEVLRYAAQKSQPAAVKSSESENDNQKPVSSEDEHQRQHEVPDQKCACPIAMLASK